MLLTEEELAEFRVKFHFLYSKDGHLVEDKVLAEMHDYYVLGREASEVYSAITGGQIQTPTYYAKDVLSMHADVLAAVLQDARTSAVEEAQQEETQ